MSVRYAALPLTEVKPEIPTRIIFSGAHCTGKTTLYNWLHNESGRTYYHVKEHPITWATFRPEPIRVIKCLGFDINKDAGDASQLAMAAYHMQTLTHADFVADRCIVDVLAYAEYIHEHNESLVTQKTINFINELVEDFLISFEGVIFFCRPIKGETIKDDGLRDLDEEFRADIDRRLYDLWTQPQFTAVQRASVYSVSEYNFLDRTALVKDVLTMKAN